MDDSSAFSLFTRPDYGKAINNMLYQCGVCKTNFRDSWDAAICFFEHENYMDFFYTLEGTDIPELCEAAIVKYGHKSQMGGCIESMADLTIQMSKYLREAEESSTDKIRESLADVLILLTQVAYICTTEEKMREELRKKAETLKYKIYSQGE